jgi:glutamate racemase
MVTDSGLGGLSICAGIVNRLMDARRFSDLSVIYFNAWPIEGKGYNYLESDAERVRVFGNALGAMRQYRPDLILIACNTLSVVFKKGKLVAGIPCPVVDIIDLGIDMIVEKLRKKPDSAVLLLGTRTTIASLTHKKRLLERGVAGSRIAQQDCHGLAGAIERDPQSQEVRSLVERYMAQAAANLPHALQQVYIALCCTHYSYSRSLIGECLRRKTDARVETIDPNLAMVDFISRRAFPPRFESVNLDVQVVSRVYLSPQKIAAIAKMIEPIDLPTAGALRDYQHIPALFEVYR